MFFSNFTFVHFSQKVENDRIDFSCKSPFPTQHPNRIWDPNPNPNPNPNRLANPIQNFEWILLLAIF